MPYLNFPLEISDYSHQYVPDIIRRAKNRDRLFVGIVTDRIVGERVLYNHHYRYESSDPQPEWNDEPSPSDDWFWAKFQDTGRNARYIIVPADGPADRQFACFKQEFNHNTEEWRV